MDTAELVIRLDDRTIVARLGPEDEDRLRALIASGQTDLTIEPSNLDTEGHGLANEIAVDVEGHALTLRLPNASDAAAIRKALAVGALTAAVAVGGIAAASMAPPAQAPAAPNVQAPQAAPAPDVATFREQRLMETLNSPYTSGAAPSEPGNAAPTEKGGSRSGPLEFNP